MKGFCIKYIYVILGLFLSLYAFTASATCSIYNSDGSEASSKGDVLYKILSHQKDCPRDVVVFKSLLEKSSLKSESTMVANRGFYNPKLGSFSFFEIVYGNWGEANFLVKKGDFFFGHFTEIKNEEIILDQIPSENKLMIELIVWDPKKQLYNFYELRGTDSASRWFYRGDSLDALKDNTYLYRDVPSGMPKFGNRMRCSACHNSGGPIMKEISLPHNDWWRAARPLPLGNHQLDAEVVKQINAVIEPQILSQAVLSGIDQLENSESYQDFKSQLSLQEQLRPLFCEVEINLQSDDTPLDNTKIVSIPSAFFITPFLHEDHFFIDKKNYENHLVKYNMNFPETTRNDADHAWLIPVKGTSDIKAIHTLIDKKIIDNKFAAAVLSIDLQNPIFSSKRCELLRLVPQEFSPRWQSEFLAALKGSDLPQARALYLQLTNPEYTFDDYVSEAKNIAYKIQISLKENQGQRQYFQKMIDSRRAVMESEISENPLGQILEPGFRVIFPQVKQP